MRLRRALSLTLAVYGASAGVQSQTTAPPPDPVELHHWRGVEYHLARRLDEAGREYAKALDLDPPRDLSADETALVRRFAPRLYTTPTEPLPLKDFAVILHPTRRLIAYHLFWEDDIDFPEDNDPSDHEVVWVGYTENGRDIEEVWTYFHGRIVAGGEAARRDARQHALRPRIDVQWGKHGSLPAGWQRLAIVDDEDSLPGRARTIEPVTLTQYNQATYRKLAGEGRRLSEHPLGQRLGWPRRFAGTWEDFIDFSRLVDPLRALDRTKMAKASRWNSATIQRHFLPYNFRPKTEWPPEIGSAAPFTPRPATNGTDSAPLDVFRLPAKAVFDASMPRYPNVWFYIDTSLAGSYGAAVTLVTGALRMAMGLQESYGPFSNPEGCDYEAGIEHLQPWSAPGQRALQHSHAFHIRYYHSALAKQVLHRLTIDGPNGAREFYRFAASAHYEVEHTNPNHADVESCPICGRTGAYGARAGNLVEVVHDPLGLELVLTGTIRGEAVRLDGSEPRALRGLPALTNQLSLEPFVFDSQQKDHNTLRIGIIVVSPPRGHE